MLWAPQAERGWVHSNQEEQDSGELWGCHWRGACAVDPGVWQDCWSQGRGSSSEGAHRTGWCEFKDLQAAWSPDRRWGTWPRMQWSRGWAGTDIVTEHALILCREPGRHCTVDKGHEEGGSAYANAGSSLRSPPGCCRASPPQKKPESAYCIALCSHLWFHWGLSPTTISLSLSKS